VELLGDNMAYEDPTFSTSASPIPRMKVNVVLNNKDKPFFTVDEWYSPEELIAVKKELDFYTDFKKLEFCEDKTLQLKLDNVYKENTNISDILNAQYKEKLELFANQVQRSFSPELLDKFLNIKSCKTTVRYFHHSMQHEEHDDDAVFTSTCFINGGEFDGGDFYIGDLKIKNHNTRLVFTPSNYERSISPVMLKDPTRKIGAGLYTITTQYYS
jgi:hypothetical protein